MSGVRSRLKWISVVVAAVFLLLLGAGLYVVVWAYTAKPRATHDYLPRMKALVAAGPETSEEAWGTFSEFSNKYLALEEELSLALARDSSITPGDIVELVRGDPQRGELAPVHEMISRLEADGLMSKLKSLSELPPARPPFDWKPHHTAPDDTPILNLTVGTIGSRRTAVFLAIAQMRLNAIRGEQTGVLSWFRVALQLSESANAVPTGVGGLVSVSLFGLLSNETVRLAGEGLLSSEAMREMSRLLKDRPGLTDIRRTVEGERIYAMEMTDSAFADCLVSSGWMVRSTGQGSQLDTVGDTHLLHDWITSDPSTEWLLNLWSPLIMSRDDTLAMMDRYYDMIAGEFAMPVSQRPTDASRFEKAFNGHPVILSLRNMTNRAWPQIASAAVLADGTRLALAVEVFRREVGRPPATLDELVPRFIEALPSDTFAKDGRFVYRVLKPGEDPEGRTYRLYSVGINLTDDGGSMNYDAEPRTDDILFDVRREEATPGE